VHIAPVIGIEPLYQRVYENGGLMLRVTVSALFLTVGCALAGCGGDDTVNPTNPDASSAKPADAGSPKDASSDGAKGDGGKEAGVSPEGGGSGEANEAGEADGGREAGETDGGAGDSEAGDT
jgi:hypothetical protein